jgi:alcohol dehydrogenase class IV
MLLPHVLAFNAVVAPEKIDTLLRTMGMGDARQPLKKRLAKLEALLIELGLSAKLSDFGYQPAHMKIIAQATLSSAQCPTNPRSSTEKDIAEIVTQMI